MRTDFVLYVVAVMFFVIATLPYIDFVSAELHRLDYPLNLTLTVIFVAMGLITLIIGYSKRPRPIIFVPETPKPTTPSPEPPEPAREEPPTAPVSEPAEPKKEKRSTRTRRKTRRRRKKA
jgi:hypothetical protein